ncbi:hypothetical protein [uncultured Senegalimassilia sp.]|uniref:Uncharacterized protein n=1 Tax=Siphoviridae sp. ctqBc4 TaxID=2827945 RepID=A0A8S5SCD2_9CAUD|nr:hypothetical protein [uncultured Senegalimassilia sp.]DAF48600.1 MAG TPA: hypothetical protein [Siphoviridae sp. ctqBc4]
MLEEVLASLNNWFVADVQHGRYSVEGGSLALDLQEGQWFVIHGSVFSDGLHQYPVSDLRDETFDGEVWALAVPPAVVSLSEEVAAWCEAHQREIDSPYQSESFGGYSYAKASDSGSQTGSYGWQQHFAKRLNRWRKL